MSSPTRRQIRIVFLSCGHQRRIGIGSEVDRFDPTAIWCRICLTERAVERNSPPRLPNA